MSKREWTESVAAVEDKTGASADVSNRFRIGTAKTNVASLVSTGLLDDRMWCTASRATAWSTRLPKCFRPKMLASSRAVTIKYFSFYRTHRK